MNSLQFWLKFYGTNYDRQMLINVIVYDRFSVKHKLRFKNIVYENKRKVGYSLWPKSII